MSQITKCDRCGIEEGKRFGMSHITFTKEGKKVREYDLCPSCINELAHMVEEWVDKYVERK